MTKDNFHKFFGYLSLPKHTNGGFTLTEILVTVAILVTVSGLMLFNYSDFSSRIALNNSAQDIALAVRQAQVYGISVRESEAGSGEFPVYGINFVGLPATSFILFADLDKSQKFENTADKKIEVFNLQRGNTLSEICGCIPPGLSCSDTISCDVLNRLDITFVRPDPEAQFDFSPASGKLYSHIRATVLSPRGDVKDIVIRANGQISIE